MPLAKFYTGPDPSVPCTFPTIATHIFLIKLVLVYIGKEQFHPSKLGAVNVVPGQPFTNLFFFFNFLVFLRKSLLWTIRKTHTASSSWNIHTHLKTDLGLIIDETKVGLTSCGTGVSLEGQHVPCVPNKVPKVLEEAPSHLPGGT